MMKLNVGRRQAGVTRDGDTISSKGIIPTTHRFLGNLALTLAGIAFIFLIVMTLIRVTRSRPVTPDTQVYTSATSANTKPNKTRKKGTYKQAKATPKVKGAKRVYHGS